MDRKQVVSMFLALGALILASGDLSAQAAGGASAMAEAQQCDLGCSTITYPGEEGTWGYACRIGAGGGGFVTGSRAARLLVATVALLPAGLVQALAAQATSRSTPTVRFELQRIVGREAALGKVLGGALGPDGSPHVLDPTTTEVIRFDPTGAVIGRFGRKGGGPGEFMLPYRITVGPDGTVHVFDFASSELSRFDSSGHFRSRHRTPFLLSQVDRIEVLPGRQVAFSGIASGYRPAEQSGVHVFDDTLAYIRSFGPVPLARDKAVLLYWGAGGITLTSQQEILYARRIPYEIYIY